jgi:hypothetical protein
VTPIVGRPFVQHIESLFTHQIAATMTQIMRRFSPLFTLLLGVVLLLPGCQVIGGIFKAGMWVGIIIVVIIIALIFGIGRMFKR